MANYSMKRKVELKEAIDLSNNQRTEQGDYVLPRFIENKDYCDLENEKWIWSIGEGLHTGVILASTSTKFYDNPDFKCLWLR